MPTAIAQETIGDVLTFHGHTCPGCTRGIRIAEVALRELGDRENGLSEPLWVMSEVDDCSVDAIQAVERLADYRPKGIISYDPLTRHRRRAPE